MKTALIISLVCLLFMMTCEVVANAAKVDHDYSNAILYGLLTIGNLIALTYHKELTEHLIKPS
jgi:positive regulator of sigma E activity